MKKAIWMILACIMVVISSSSYAQTVTMTFVGDCVLGTNVDWPENDERTFPNVIAREGMDYPFAKVRDLFMEDDLTVVNLEGVLADTNEGMLGGRKYNFRGKTVYAQMLADASVELAVMGNNHTRDFGTPGIASTKTALSSAGVGYALNEEAFIFEQDGIRIGVISYISNIYSKHREEMPEIVRVLREERGCSSVVLCIHAGEEYSMHRSYGQRAIARSAIDAGIDLVIGHHPHVLQGLEIYKDRNIVYSVGNFVFGGNRKIRKEHRGAMAARVEMKFEDGVYVGQRLTVLPVIVTATLDRNNYQPYLAQGEEAQEVMQIIQRDTPYELAPFEEGVGAIQPWLPAQESAETQ